MINKNDSVVDQRRPDQSPSHEGAHQETEPSAQADNAAKAEQQQRWIEDEGELRGRQRGPQPRNMPDELVGNVE